MPLVPAEKIQQRCQEGSSNSQLAVGTEIFSSGWKYFLIIFLSAITRILEGEETLIKSTLPHDNYWKSPVGMSLSVQSNLLAIVSHVK